MDSHFLRSVSPRYPSPSSPQATTQRPSRSSSPTHPWPRWCWVTPGSLNTILGWIGVVTPCRSRAWYASCLVSAGFSVSGSVLQDEMGSLSNVPEEYLDLKEVFSKSRAASLPPHRPYDCAIDLVPGMSLPKGRLYSLSVPEREAMEKYISDSLTAGFIRPSSSPAGAGFFFCCEEGWFSATLYWLPGLEQHHGKEYLSFAVDVFSLREVAGSIHLHQVRS